MIADSALPPGWAERQRALRAELSTVNGFPPSADRDACGVGFIAAIDGKPRREVVEKAIEALCNVWHRGAVDADGRTGDGAGLHLDIPGHFFDDEIRRTGHEPQPGPLAVGQIFLPRQDFAAQETCKSIVESEMLDLGYALYGWRHVPVEVSVLGTKADSTRPEIAQIMVAGPTGIAPDEFERQLYLARRRMEWRATAAQVTDFYVCSLSCRSIVYKGMMLAEQVSAFYPDLQDERFESRYALFHQRYSTNTFPQWWLAQPFRALAHNGEINTLRGNANWMSSHEIRLAHEGFGNRAEDVKPVIPAGASDSGALDAVFELLVRAGREAPMAKTLLIPEAWSKKATAMPDKWRDLYSYANAVMEPWDGPAAIVATDGRWVITGTDRNGLRPMRYQITRSGLAIAGSETGMVSVPDPDVIEKGRLGPGQIVGVNLEAGEVRHDQEIKEALASARPFQEWTSRIVDLTPRVRGAVETQNLAIADLRRLQVAARYSIEELEAILHPMVEDAKEVVGSMGDDAPLAVLSDQRRPLSHFFRQNFSQVTNPPIDPLREHRVMSLNTRFGNLKNVLDEGQTQTENLLLDSPVVLNEQFAEMCRAFGDADLELDCLFPTNGEADALRKALSGLRTDAEDAVRAGVAHLVLTDERMDSENAAIPMILATSAVHSWLVRQGLRTFCSISVRSAECIDPHHFAVLIGCGATTVNAWLAQESVADRHRRGLFGNLSLAACLDRYREAAEQGLLKIMSKMGISVVSSYRGGYNFEAIGLSRSLVSEYFPGMASRVSGIGLSGIEQNALAVHARAFRADVVTLPVGGFYKARARSETHSWDARGMHLMQSACNSGSLELWRRFAQRLHEMPPTHLRDLLGFRSAGPRLPLEDVESIASIRRRFVTPGMSLGALSPEAHETLNIAMNRIGARSDSGEGGEDLERTLQSHDGENRAARIKQIASGRFGVTLAYLNACDEIEIKVAQGAKPGEGGQLPGFKVTETIARLRHSTPGVSLISPPPHHDIYSIEDLAQLIYDLKQANPDARVTVKLVASTGVGTIAAGVAKAKADIILISGHNGGTGAAAQTSIKHVGLPWEMGLSEAHQILTLNDLRERVILRTDGSIRTARDVVMAAMMGAEEYGVGTAALVAMGCIMVRQCHSNTCPVGVCTQDPRLRAKFTGSPEKVVNFFTLLAGEVREQLASLGVRSIDEIVGRTDLLKQVSRGASHLDDLDLSPLLTRIEKAGAPSLARARHQGRVEVPDTLDAEILRDAEPFLRDGRKMDLSYTVRNTQRAVGTRLSAQISRRFGPEINLSSGHLTLRLEGSAGQSLGAFAAQGLRIEVRGDANDYVGKGLSGGEIVLRPPLDSALVPHENTIIGNTVLYGATGGRLFANGQAGERFAVRNSGAEAVVEGCGANGCEYMTGGTVALLGRVGDNFGAGMTGGMAFVYDSAGDFVERLNEDTVIAVRIGSTHWESVLRNLIEAHADATESPRAVDLLQAWDRTLGRIWQVCPKELVDRIEHPLTDREPVRATA